MASDLKKYLVMWQTFNKRGKERKIKRNKGNETIIEENDEDYLKERVPEENTLMGCGLDL